MSSSVDTDSPLYKKTKTAFISRLKKRIDPKAIDVVLRHCHWDEHKAKMWFELPNPMMGGSSPMNLIKAGRKHKVEAMIFASEEEM